MPAVVEAVRLIAIESERMLGPVPPSDAKHCARLTSQVGLGAVLGFDPTSTFPTPSIAVYGLLRSKQVAFELPSIKKQNSESTENPKVHFSSP